MRTLRRAVTAFLLLKLGVLSYNLLAFPVLKGTLRPRVHGQPASVSPERVSLLVPMRNESARLGDSLPSLLAQPVAEVILLDDESDDDTAELARRLAGNHPHVRVIAGRAAPAGWIGKNWACHQLAEQATGDVLVFCDADVRLGAGAIEDVLTEMDYQRADVFSVFPRQLTVSLGERLLVPIIDDVLLCFLPFRLLSEPVPSAATANGSLLAFTRPGYDKVGGFAAVRAAIVEDVEIARLVRRAGLKLGLALGGDVVQTRMYGGYSAAVQGFGRGLLSMAGGSRLRLLAGFGWQLAAYTIPVVLTVRNRKWIVPVVLGLFERALVDLKSGRGGDPVLLLSPFAPVAAAPVIGQALRRSQRWKGRVYR